LNLINARYKLNEEEIDFLIAIIKNNLASLDTKKDDLKFIKKFMVKMLDIQTNDRLIFLNWFDKVKYDANSSLFDIKLQNDVELFLLELSEDLSSEDLKRFFSLSSNYSRAIYKLLKVHQHKSRANINLEELKTKLQVPKGLNLYSNFKMKVLSVAQQEIKENTDLSFTVEEKKDGKKVTSLIFNIYSNDEVKPEKVKNLVIKKEVQNLFTEVSEKKEIQINEPKKRIIKSELDEKDADIKRIVSFFDMERKKLQPNYVRKESSYNMSGEYLLRVHLKETGRTPQMFFDAIRWLFSNNPKASFHRQYIMNIGKLIEHFNTLEHQAMYSQEAVQFNEEAQAWYNIYKKQGLSKEEILEKLREGEYIK